MTLQHAAIWLDRHHAVVVHFANLEGETRAGQFKHPADDHIEAFYKELAAALKGTREILVMGPGQAKGEFVKYLKTHAAETAGAVMDIISADHPSEGQILAEARKYFQARDRMVAH